MWSMAHLNLLTGNVRKHLCSALYSLDDGAAPLLVLQQLMQVCVCVLICSFFAMSSKGFI